MQIETKQDVAKALLELFGPDGEHWTQGAYATDASGLSVPPFDEDACRFCIFGGVLRLAANRKGVGTEFQAEFPGKDPIEFNDTHDWPTVKAKLESIANGN